MGGGRLTRRIPNWEKLGFFLTKNQLLDQSYRPRGLEDHSDQALREDTLPAPPYRATSGSRTKGRCPANKARRDNPQKYYDLLTKNDGLDGSMRMKSIMRRKEKRKTWGINSLFESEEKGLREHKEKKRIQASKA